LLHLFDPALENTFDEVGRQISRRFNEGSENNRQLKEESSRKFTVEPGKEEKVGGYNLLAVGHIRVSLESELHHLLRIEFDFLPLHYSYGALCVVTYLSTLFLE
jgi:hypothetical protein